MKKATEPLRSSEKRSISTQPVPAARRKIEPFLLKSNDLNHEQKSFVSPAKMAEEVAAASLQLEEDNVLSFSTGMKPNERLDFHGVARDPDIN